MSFVLRSPLLVNCLKTRQVAILSSPGRQALINNVRLFGNNTGRSTGRASRVHVKQSIEVKQAPTRSLKEILMQPTSGTPFALGSGAVAGGALLGIGALCYYGLGMSKTAGAYENSLYVFYFIGLICKTNFYLFTFSAWPEYVRDRVKTTYLYFGSGLGITAASAMAVFRSPRMMNLMTRNSFGVSSIFVGVIKCSSYSFIFFLTGNSLDYWRNDWHFNDRSVDSVQGGLRH